jgi:hypothetical protein
MPLDAPLQESAEDTIAACRQPYPLPPDVRYVVDNILADDEIDEGSYIALNLFLPRQPIFDVIGNPNVGDEHEPSGYVRRRGLGLKLMELVEAALPALPMEVQNGLAFSSLQWLRRDLENLAWVYARWAFEDSIIGGCQKAWLRPPRIRRTGEPFKRTLRRLHAPSFIARQVKAQEESEPRRARASRILDRVEGATGLSDRFCLYALDLAEQREQARREAMRQFLAAHRKTADKTAATRKRVHLERAVIRRSLRVASAVLPDAQVRAFVHGESIRIPGAAFDLAVKLQTSITSQGHGVLDVNAVTRDGAMLASFCVYHTKTPALDQLTAMALAMGAGEEAEIIRDANIIQMFPAGREHPLLADREKREAADRAAAVARIEAQDRVRVDRSHWSSQELECRANAYWDATKHIWIGRLAVFACGRRVKLLGLAAATNPSA